MVMEGSHFVDVAGKFLLRLSKLNMLLLVLFSDDVEATVQIVNLFRQLAQRAGMLQIPLL